MSRHLRGALALIRINFKEVVQYRSSLVLLALGNGFGLWLLFWLWGALFASNPGRAGLSFQSALLHVAVAQTLFVVVQSYTDWGFARQIRSGAVATYLTQPLALPVRYFALACGRVAVHALAHIPVFLLFAWWAGLAPADTHWLLALPSLLLAFVLIFCVDFTIGLAGFMAADLWGITASKDALLLFLGGAYLPIAFFPEAVRTVMHWLPFAHFYQTPVAYLTGESSAGLPLLQQALWCVAFLGLVLLASRHVQRKLVVFGA
ncbi:hypothetical protein IGB42_01425 [Andreprevotia sp. IGB-42]|uniref:ABC transporter permease n=1 Tax=Andreprevotia sp. IGB-42 TaxID=2497473 RepID=UPI00135CEC68|nr:ABC-2 family transporter protein [Andreprevotia sp. IGB-42]KAF0813746.1 hypothetical protein IGB42_01425 [Andreprevotia sp. IGB-42]